MRVLAVTNIYPTPSAPASGTFVEQQVAGLRSLGLDVTVTFIDRERHGMHAYLRVPSVVRRAMADTQPDIVHVMYGGVMADLATRAVRDTPTIVTFHGSDLLGEQLANPVRRAIAGYGVIASRRAARRASGVVVVADELRRELEGVADPSTVRVIPCGVDFNRFRPLDRSDCRTQLGWDSDCFHVLFNDGSGDPVKRPSLATAAVERLKDLGVRADLHVMRGLRNEDVPIWLGASDALLLTSLHEGSPTVVKEALACNIPVVSVDVGDVRRRLAGIEGCHIAEANPDDLAVKLRSVREAGHSVEARDKVLDLSLEYTAASVAAFYREVLDGCQRRSRPERG